VALRDGVLSYITGYPARPYQTEKTMKKYLAAAGAVALALSLGACSDDSDDNSAATTGVTESTESAGAGETSTPEDGEEGMETDIVDTAGTTGEFTTLITAVQAAGLEDTLRGGGPFTVFAPTDEAFSTLPAGALDDLLAEPTGDLADILRYHVVDGAVMAEDIAGMDGETVTTVLGEDLTVEVDGDKVYLVDGTGNRATVTATDVKASNGSSTLSTACSCRPATVSPTTVVRANDSTTAPVRGVNAVQEHHALMHNPYRCDSTTRPAAVIDRPLCRPARP